MRRQLIGFDKAKQEFLKSFKRLSTTLKCDIPTAAQKLIKGIEGDIKKEKEKIRKTEIKIRKLDEKKSLAESALTSFWIRETDMHKKLLK